MAAIAHYWFYNDTADTIISTVIFHDDCRGYQNEDQPVLYGKNNTTFRKEPNLAQMNMHSFLNCIKANCLKRLP